MVNYSFHCTACGRCCNSPPLLSMVELFQFSEVFIGSLAVRRLGHKGDRQRAALLDRIAFPAPGPLGATHIAILPMGYAYETVRHCPALREDRGCMLHDAGKPLQCQVVPLDPLAADWQQGRVLGERMADAIWRQAGCVAEAAAGTQRLLVAADQVTDPAYGTLIDARRTAMATDKQAWGQAVFDMLRADWRATDAALAAVPPGGVVALPVLPAVLALAALSEAWRQRCVAFLRAQRALIEVTVQRAVQRKQPDDRETTQRLRGWAAAYRAALDGFEQEGKQFFLEKKNQKTFVPSGHNVPPPPVPRAVLN